MSDWPDFIQRFLDDKKITDLVLHGDQRIYHRAAVSAARERGVYVAVSELGYLRPGWMTLERDGLSTLSHFPKDPERIRKIAESVAPIDLGPQFPASFYLQTVPDVIYNLTNVFLKFLYPHYERHTIYPPVLEYLRGAWRLLDEKRRNRIAHDKIRALKASKQPFFVLPLQLEGDFQLRRHSPYESFSDVLEVILSSFAKEAPSDAVLAIKTHPLDVGFENWPAEIDRLARDSGLQGRIVFLDGGGLGPLFEGAAGLVTLNSTAGLEALQAGCPVKTLVPAHYDVEGLTHSGTLASFWNAPAKPDGDLLAAYVMAIAGTIQVRGSIHNQEGGPVAARNIAERLLERRLNEPGGFEAEPPRLAAARALGVPL
ncbi:capsule biosynthesis protein [Roseibium hamelinense]|uniref:capsule biosynthesis protein n=1 Tax=Roseibium hamelinense TaxID=150831 RepID=UPI001AD92708